MQKSSESCPLHVQELDPFVKFQAFDSGFLVFALKESIKLGFFHELGKN